MILSKFLAISLATGILALVGCGGPYDASVSGIVTLDGEPLARGTVTFSNLSGGPPAYARIESDGDYTVRTGREKGLPAGEYGVSVVAKEPPAVRQSQGGGPPPPGKAISPPWYKTSESSGLKFDVKRGSNTIDIELSSEPPPDWKPEPTRRRRR